MARNTYREDEKLRETVNIKTVFRLFSYLQPYKKEVAKTLFLIAVVIVVSLTNPLLLRLAINDYIANKNMLGLAVLGAVMTGINLASTLCSRFRILTMSVVSGKILLRIRQDLFQHIQKLSFTFSTRAAGKILARIMGDVNSLGELFSTSVTILSRKQ